MVRRRVVCYLSGFDPQGPGHYHQLYLEAAAAQGRLAACPVTVGPRRRLDAVTAAWEVQCSAAEGDVHTRHEFWRWDDVVREHWPRGRWQLIQRTLWAIAAMSRNGIMALVLRRSWPVFVAMVMPVLLMLALTAGALALLSAVAALVPAAGIWTAMLVLLAGLVALLMLARVAEEHSQMGWLMRSMSCLLKQGCGQTPSLDQRLDVHAARLARLLRANEADEVLVVGHSSGAMMACIVWARALAHLPPDLSPETCGIRWSLLTLGHCSQILSEQPEAQAYREELTRLSNDGRVDWVDVTSPVDSCCMALVPPTEFSARYGGPLPRRPKLINPRFIQLFDAAHYRRLRRDKFRCHFQYIMAGERTGEWDYIAITAGPQSLADRFADTPGVGDFRGFALFGGRRAT